MTDFHPFNMLTGMRTSYFHGGVKFNLPNTVRLASDIVEAAARRGLQLKAFHECGSIYPGLPATLVLMFSPPVPR